MVCREAKGLLVRISPTSFLFFFFFFLRRQLLTLIKTSTNWISPGRHGLDSVSLHLNDAADRGMQGEVIESHRDVWGLRCFHHDVLWQHNYALYLTSHGSPSHISSSLLAATGAEGGSAGRKRGLGGEGGEAWSLKRSTCKAKGSGLEARRRGGWMGMSEERQRSFTLHHRQIKGTGEKSRSWGTEGQGWQKSGVRGARGESVDPETSAATAHNWKAI